jgi:hypothetical protein
MDGDGSVLDVTYYGTGKARGRRYRTLCVRFNTASNVHAYWLRARIAQTYGLHGGLALKNRLYRLTYAKKASLRLLPILYPGPDIPCLRRKRAIWERFVDEAGAVTG